MTDPKTHAQVRGDRNCPTCRGTGVRDCSGSVLYDNDGRVRSSSSATTPCYCAKATPAVPDDVAETAKRLQQATFTKGRMRGGIIGQTIEAAMRSTFYEVSAWDLLAAADALEAQAAELAQAKAESARFRLLLGEIATLGRCDFAKVRAAIQTTGDCT